MCIINLKSERCVYMQVKSVENQSFQARGDRNLGTYNPRKNPRHNIDAVIALDDNSIRTLAYHKTMHDVEDKKHSNIRKGLLISIPVVAGVTAALLNPAKSSLISKEIKGTAARLLNGAKTTAGWGVVFGAFAGAFGARHLLEKKSEAAREFSKENPMLTYFATAATAIGALALGGKYIPKMIEKVGNHVKPSSILKVENSIVKGSEKFNSSKVISKVTEFARNLKNNKHLEPLKSVVKTALEWAPTTLVFGTLLHTVNHSNVRNKEMVKNYSEMKEFQNKLAKARIRELSVQNDFLMQDARNREDLYLMKNSLAGLPEDVAEKVSKLQAHDA